MSETLKLFLPVAGTVIGAAVLIRGTHWLLIGRHPELGSERKFARQLIVFGLTLLGILAVILVLPISDGSRNRLLGLIGILLSTILALSSTTIFGNLVAGVVLRIKKPFKTGDFIRVNDYFGRVSERGLFDTEIQTESRELVALPNMYCVNNPVTTIRSSGTIISATLSLGYEVDHAQIDALLIEAAGKADLTEPFVHILELQDFSVSYRISGLLADPRFLISARSKLYASVLDTLHSHGIEIMSPAYMNQRRLDDSYRAVPATVIVPPADIAAGSVEEIAFDKAERAEQLEHEKEKLTAEIEEIVKAQKQVEDEQGKSALDSGLERAKTRLQNIEEAMRALESEDEQTEQDGTEREQGGTITPAR